MDQGPGSDDHLPRPGRRPRGPGRTDTLLERLYHGVAEDREKMARYSLIEVKPEKEF